MQAFSPQLAPDQKRPNEGLQADSGYRRSGMCAAWQQWRDNVCGVLPAPPLPLKPSVRIAVFLRKVNNPNEEMA
jgi:hypothetical protein